MFDPKIWAAVPFHFWSGVFFVFGSIVGSFLNVCIHRMPRGESLIKPPSHCPHCGYSIPWYLNIPLVTWVYLRGQCAHCRAAISARYFIVELLTGLLFLAAWLHVGQLNVGRYSAPLALVYCLLLAGFVVATFIDFEHFIIPDEITIGGIVVGFVVSFFVPLLHHALTPGAALRKSFVGIVVGAGMIYLILRIGKLLFGRQKIELEPHARIVFTETTLVLPDRTIAYEDIFYRKSDTLTVEAKTLELVDRCYQGITIKLSPDKLQLGEESLNPEDVPHMEVCADKLVLPREAMGLGDVKFMGAIGAFLGWEATVFALMASSIIGALVGVTLILTGRREWSGRLPYGPYIALAATIWIFWGPQIWAFWLPR